MPRTPQCIIVHVTVVDSAGVATCQFRANPADRFYDIAEHTIDSIVHCVEALATDSPCKDFEASRN
jgi:hypothetical protein